MHPVPVDRSTAEALDVADPLARFRDDFELPAGPSRGPVPIYLAGNSLGLRSRSAVRAVRRELDRWGSRAIAGWDERWLDLAGETADRLADLTGARPGSVRVADSTTVSLHKLADAALGSDEGRPDVVAEAGVFPTDRYILDAVAARRGGKVRVLEGIPDADAVADVADARVGLVALSHVDFRTGALLDLPGITDVTHRAGALSLWDLSHSVGVVPTGLDAAGADMAVGCTYKYLFGGPGSPAFVYARPGLSDRLKSPIPGWFGHAEPFAMDPTYRPAPGVGRFLSGTPPLLSLAALSGALDVVLDAGVGDIRAKSELLTGLAIEVAEELLSGDGVEVATPRRADRRGSQVALRHPDGWRVTRMLVEELGVTADFRDPDIVRLGLSPLTTRYADVVEALDRMHAGLVDRAHERFAPDRPSVT